MNQGHSYAWDQEWKKAATSYRRALEEFPDHPKALSSLGLALLQSQQFEEALANLYKSRQVSPTDPVPFERIAQLSERLGQLKQASEAAMKAAELYLNNRDVEKAIENWGHVTMLNPEHILARSRLALTHEKLGHKQQAVIEYIAVASLLQRGWEPGKSHRTGQQGDENGAGQRRSQAGAVIAARRAVASQTGSTAGRHGPLDDVTGQAVESAYGPCRIIHGPGC
jgi:tetratricopeptide (TPR) repeat protein